MLEQLEPYLLEIIAGILTAIASFVGLKIKSLYEKKVKDDTKRKVVNTVVNAIEQIYKDLKGQEKLNKAKENIVIMLNEKGITITDLEMEMLIEEICNSFNNSLKGDVQIDK